MYIAVFLVCMVGKGVCFEFSNVDSFYVEQPLTYSDCVRQLESWKRSLSSFPIPFNLVIKKKQCDPED